MTDRKILVDHAIAMQAIGEFGEMKEAMGKVLEIYKEFTEEECALFRDAYYKALKKVESQFLSDGSLKENTPQTRAYLQQTNDQLKKQFVELCEEFIFKAGQYAIPQCGRGKSANATFLLSSVGTFYMQMARVRDDPERIHYLQQASIKFQAAVETAEENLNTSHPTRLAAAGTYATFLKQVCKDKRYALEVALKAYNDAKYSTVPTRNPFGFEYQKEKLKNLIQQLSEATSIYFVNL